jgi:hypothetical protein
LNPGRDFENSLAREQQLSGDKLAELAQKWRIQRMQPKCRNCGRKFIVVSTVDSHLLGQNFDFEAAQRRKKIARQFIGG